MRFLSFGGGVQTTAMLLEFWKEYDAVVFADTGSEREETYTLLRDWIRPFVNKNGINFIVARNGQYESLEDYCLQNKCIPMRNFRWCTDKFKTRPIEKWAKDMGATDENPFIQVMGISLDEAKRVNESKDHETDLEKVYFIKKEFQLLDKKLTRTDCEDIIAKHGWPKVAKSGCWFCPFARIEEFRQMAAHKPELFQKLIQLEKNNANYPNTVIKYKPMEKRDFNQYLTDFFGDIMDAEVADEADDMCDSGHCFR